MKGGKQQQSDIMVMVVRVRSYEVRLRSKAPEGGDVGTKVRSRNILEARSREKNLPEHLRRGRLEKNETAYPLTDLSSKSS